MKIASTPLAGLLVLKPSVYRDERGYFYESWNRRRFAEAGIEANFVQDNRSYSATNVLRGLHFTWHRPQAQLVWVVEGTIFDVCVDLRVASSTFGRWYGVELAADQQLYMPPGIAHGFCVLGHGAAAVHYKCSEFYDPHDEGGIIWNDPDLAITWPVDRPVVSAKDSAFPSFATVAARLRAGSE